MDFQPVEYERKTFCVKAEEVTFKNVEQVAKWCKGKVEFEPTKILGGAETDLPIVKFPGQGEDRGKELIARLGYFVVEARGRFRVYRAPQFWAAFNKKTKDEPAECNRQHQDNGLPTPQLEEEIWIEPGDTTDEIAAKLGFEKVDHPHGIQA